MVAGPFHSWPPNSPSGYENWTDPRVYLAEPLVWQLIAARTPLLRLEETARDKVLKLMRPEGLGVTRLHIPGSLFCGGNPCLWVDRPPSPEEGQLESHLTSFFPSSLGGFWWNSAVAWLGEMHVLLHVLHRECVFCHRVSLGSVHSSEQLFTSHVVTFCS